MSLILLLKFKYFVCEFFIFSVYSSDFLLWFHPTPKYNCPSVCMSVHGVLASTVHRMCSALITTITRIK